MDTAGTMAAAALQAMSSINKIRSDGGENHEIFRIAQKFGTKEETHIHTNISSMKYWVAAVLAIAAIGTFFCMPERHDVSGKAWIGRAPLQAEIKFHHENGEPVSVNADQKGEFRATGLKPGRYKITVHAQGISPVYSDEMSSPIMIPVRKDMENVRIQVTNKPIKKKNS